MRRVYEDDDEPKTRPADSRHMLLVTLANFETRFELLQKRLVEAQGLSGPALTLIRNELAGLQRSIERVLAAVEQATKAAALPPPGPPKPDRF